MRSVVSNVQATACEIMEQLSEAFGVMLRRSWPKYFFFVHSIKKTPNKPLLFVFVYEENKLSEMNLTTSHRFEAYNFIQQKFLFLVYQGKLSIKIY